MKEIRIINTNPILPVIVLLTILAVCLLTGCGNNDQDANEGYSWPEGALAQMLPVPKGTITSCSCDEETLSAEVTCSREDANDFMNGCKDKGFTVNPSESQYDDSMDYTAKNNDGYEVSAYYYDGTLSISLYSPEWLKDIESDPEEETSDSEEESSDDSSEDTVTKEKKDNKKVSSDFKETMDDYESFMDEYIEFMESYQDSDDVVSMAGDYADLVSKYAEYTKKIDNIDEDSLSNEDLNYYLEVTARVNEKLANASL